MLWLSKLVNAKYKVIHLISVDFQQGKQHDSCAIVSPNVDSPSLHSMAPSMENTAVFDEILGLHKKLKVYSVQRLASVHFKYAHLETFQ